MIAMIAESAMSDGMMIEESTMTKMTAPCFAMLHKQILELQARVAKLEALSRSMSLETVNDQPTVRFTGVNVQVVNGQGSTDTANGTGNLIVGYNELRQDNLDRCEQVWLTCTDTRTGSHNVVVGREHNYARFGGVVVGLHNETSGDFSAVGGGAGNIPAVPFLQSVGERETPRQGMGL